jgi:hypothetical protein
MTQFTDPHNLGGRFSGFQDFSAPSQQAGFPSPAAFISPGFTTTIQYPIGRTGGAVPANLGWVIIANVSPFALGMSQQRFLGTLAPFTADKFQVSGTGNITFQPTLPVGFTTLTETVAGNSGAYATWFEQDPGGSYPCAVGPAFGESAQLIQSIAFGGGAGPNLIDVPTEPWMQTIAFRLVQTAGTANGFSVVLRDTFVMTLVSDPGSAQTVFNTGQWVYLPTNGSPPTITITNLINGAAAGTMAGQLQIYGLATSIEMPMNGPLLIAGTPATQMGLTSSAVIGAGGTAVVIPNPPTGTMILIRGIRWAYGNAPAAVGTDTMFGTVSGATYWRVVHTATAGFQVYDPASWMVGESGLVDRGEGLSATNNASQTAAYDIRYDIIPWPNGTYSP